MPRISELQVNGKTLRVDADAERSLLSVLRDDLQLTGAKYGCGEGECGACTVLVDSAPTHSCLTTVGKVGQKQVTTIEGLEENGQLHVLQETFLEVGAMQCGYCTSGMIMAAVGLLKTNPTPSERDIARLMDRNVCRCGTHLRIVQAIRLAADRLRATAGASR